MTISGIRAQFWRILVTVTQRSRGIRFPPWLVIANVVRKQSALGQVHQEHEDTETCRASRKQAAAAVLATHQAEQVS